MLPSNVLGADSEHTKTGSPIETFGDDSLVGLPEDFKTRIAHILPQEAVSYFRPKLYQTFRINTLKTSVEEVQTFLSAAKIDFEVSLLL